VWTSPLHSCPEACELLGVTKEEVAILCAVVAKGRAGKITEPTLEPKSLSMESLWMYVLKNKSSANEWTDLVQCWDNRLTAVAPDITGAGWIGRLFDTLAVVGRKPLAVQLQINELEVHVGVRDIFQVWETIYLKEVALFVKQALDKKQHLVPSGGNFKTPAEYQSSAQELVSLVRRLVDVGSRSIDSVAATTDVTVCGGSVLQASFKVADMCADAALPDALDLMVPGINAVVPATQIRTRLDESGGYHIDLTWHDFGNPDALSAAVQALSALGEGDDPKGAASDAEANDRPALLNVKLYLEALAVHMRKGRLHLSSEAVQAEVAIHNSVLSQNFADKARICALRHNSVLNGSSGDPSVDVKCTTQEDLDQAVAAFLLPLLFDSEHGLGISMSRIKVTVTKPTACDETRPSSEGPQNSQGVQPNALEMSLVAQSEGTVELQLPLSKLVTEVLDIVEIQVRQTRFLFVVNSLLTRPTCLQKRMVRESLFADSDDIGLMRGAASEIVAGAFDFEFDDTRVTEEQVRAEFDEFDEECAV
jgi:hypothetical protein